MKLCYLRVASLSVILKHPVKVVGWNDMMFCPYAYVRHVWLSVKGHVSCETFRYRVGTLSRNFGSCCTVSVV